MDRLDTSVLIAEQTGRTGTVAGVMSDWVSLPRGRSHTFFVEVSAAAGAGSLLSVSIEGQTESADQKIELCQFSNITLASAPALRAFRLQRPTTQTQRDESQNLGPGAGAQLVLPKVRANWTLVAGAGTGWSFKIYVVPD